MLKKILLLISIILNLILIAGLLYVFSVSTIPKERIDNVSKSTKRITRIYKDKKTGANLSITETEAYYPDGKIRYSGVMINGVYKYFISYTPDGKILGEISSEKGKLIIPDKTGNITPQGTTSPFSKANCYYRYGEAITENEYLRREKLQNNRINNAFQTSSSKEKKQLKLPYDMKNALLRGKKLMAEPLSEK